MRTINAEIIAVGTELLLGQIANTNGQWISEHLAKNGINVYSHHVVGDNFKRLVNTFLQAQKRSNLIIVTGGLGPTDDDITREAFQAISNMSIIEHKPSMEKILSYFKQQKQEMTPNNRKQARIFKEAMVLENKVGMAPGMIVEFQKRTWIFLPGVPREMKQLMSDEVLPYLMKQKTEVSVIQSTVLRFIGIGESRLEHELHDLMKQQENPTIAPLAQNDGIIIRLTAKARNKAEANHLLLQTKEKIIQRVGKFYYGADEETIEKVLVDELKNKKRTLSAAESLTGGKFTERMIRPSGASTICPGGIIAYDAYVKQHVLGVKENTINNHGTVSRECALEMARNVSNLFKADIGISFTGVAGPNQMENQPVGTVYISVYQKKGKQIVESYQFNGDREEIRQRAVIKGMEILLTLLKS